MIPALQYLRHGKALCGKVFKRFVETFNYHNDFIANLIGDGDLPTSDGCIKIDRTDPTHPVIRLDRNNLGLPDSPSGDGRFPSRFEIALAEDEPPEGSDADPTYTATFANPYYDVGGKTYELTGGGQVSCSGDCIICLKVSAKEHPSATLETFGSIQIVTNQQTNEDYYTIPLYKVQGGKVVCDFRTGPISGMGEF